MAGTPDDWVALAVVTQPHGVRGQLKVKSFSDPAKGFADYTELTDDTGRAVRPRIEGEAQGLFIVRIDGIADRNEADRWRGRKLGVPRSALKPLADDGRFYVTDLEGMDVVSPEGAPMGRVSGVANYGAGDLLEITDSEGRSEFYTFTDRNFPHIDRDARRITFTPPEILGSRDEEGAA